MQNFNINSHIGSEDLWKKFQETLKDKYGEDTFKSWFSKLSLEKIEENNVILLAPTSFIRDWIETNYSSDITVIFAELLSTIVSVDIIVDKNSKIAQKADAEDSADFSVDKKNVTNDNKDNFNTPLDPNFIFENFIVGDSNSLVKAAAASIAAQDKIMPVANPLFIYSAVGLGKTHIAQSIVCDARIKNPKKQIAYLSAERFMYQFIRASKNNNILTFKENFADIDMLVIDDIQFISGKNGTQVEFLSICDNLISKNCQLVIIGNKAPSHLDGISERMRSRFSGGLVVAIDKPDYDLRYKILEQKALKLNIDLDEDVKAFIVENITTSIRELEGALNKVAANSLMINMPINLTNVKHIIADLIVTKNKQLNIDEIKKFVAGYYNVKISELDLKVRTKNIVRARQVAIYFSKELTSLSLMDIGKNFGGRDHATVIYTAKKVSELAKTDHSFKSEIDKLMNDLKYLS